MATIQDAQAGCAFDISELGNARHTSTRFHPGTGVPTGSGPVNGVLVNDASLNKLVNGQYSAKGGGGSFSITLEVAPPVGVTQVVTATVIFGGCTVNGVQSANFSFTSANFGTPQTCAIGTAYQGASRIVVSSPECLTATLDFLN